MARNAQAQQEDWVGRAAPPTPPVATLERGALQVGGGGTPHSSFLGPYDVAARRALSGQPLPAFTCPPPPPPQTDVTGKVFYLPGTGHAQIDAAAHAADERLAKPINDYMAFVVHTADDYMRSQPADPDRAACVLRWLDAWAQAGALLRAPDQQGRYLRNWTQADLAIAYLTVRDAPALDPAAKRRVVRWFGTVGAAVNADFRDRWERNNHLYWAAVSAVSAGAVTGDRALFDWGVDTARTALAEIAPDGTLPRELARRGKALSYHAFALQALELVAAFAARNGTDLWHARDGALLRLADLLVRDLQDPTIMAAKSGYPQDTSDLQGWPSRRALSWAEPYYAVTHDARLVPFLRAARPWIGSTRNGGDMTLAFGVALPQGGASGAGTSD
jgi:poly(beta-D-mannuronate) lyase